MTMNTKMNLNPKTKRALYLFSILLFALASLLPFSFSTTAASAGWIMCYFTENPNNYDLHLAYSTDALHWTALNNGAAVAHPTSGKQGLRDPFILKKQDGTFVVMATDMNGTDFVNGTSPYIHIWDSADLCTFSNYRWVRMTSTNMHAWAPEAFYDSSRGQYAILWSGNSNYNKIYVNYTTDFRNVGTEQVYFDPGFSVLDADVITGSTNYLYYKRESDNRLYGSKSASLNPGSFNNGTYTSGLLQGNAIEAPELVPNGSTWYLYGDSYSPTNGVLYVWKTTNIGGNSWSALSRGSYQQPPSAKHPGIVAVSADQMTKILARWGGGSTPTPTPGSGGSYVKLRNRTTNLCIDGMGRTSNGSNAGQYASGSSYNQQWTLEAAGSYYKIRNRATGLYLDGMGRTSNGSICGQYSGNTSNNQQWTREIAGSYYKFKNRGTGLYLDGMGSTSNGADLCQWGSSQSYNQQWSVVAP
jgi:hypothetical protein